MDFVVEQIVRRERLFAVPHPYSRDNKCGRWYCSNGGRTTFLPGFGMAIHHHPRRRFPCAVHRLRLTWILAAAAAAAVDPRRWPVAVVHVIENVARHAVDFFLGGAQVVDEAFDLGGSAARGGDEGDVGGEETEGEGEDAEDVGGGGEG